MNDMIPNPMKLHEENQQLRRMIDSLKEELRDQFAMAAISPLLTGAVLPTKEDRDKWLPLMAEIAYEVADAMIQARQK